MFLMRLLDHRHVIQDLWQETIQFALQMPGMEEIALRFTNEQIATLFNIHSHAISTTFNLYALGKQDIII
jgi:hypothetical protein